MLADEENLGTGFGIHSLLRAVLKAFQFMQTCGALYCYLSPSLFLSLFFTPCSTKLYSINTLQCKKQRNVQHTEVTFFDLSWLDCSLRLVGKTTMKLTYETLTRKANEVFGDMNWTQEHSEMVQHYVSTMDPNYQ